MLVAARVTKPSTTLETEMDRMEGSSKTRWLTGHHRQEDRRQMSWQHKSHQKPHNPSERTLVCWLFGMPCPLPSLECLWHDRGPMSWPWYPPTVPIQWRETHEVKQYIKYANLSDCIMFLYVMLRWCLQPPARMFSGRVNILWHTEDINEKRGKQVILFINYEKEDLMQGALHVDKNEPSFVWIWVCRPIKVNGPCAWSRISLETL